MCDMGSPPKMQRDTFHHAAGVELDLAQTVQRPLNNDDRVFLDHLQYNFRLPYYIARRRIEKWHAVALLSPALSLYQWLVGMA
jgi:hypothetical protein